MDLQGNPDRFHDGEYVDKRLNSLKIPEKIKAAVTEGLKTKQIWMNRPGIKRSWTLAELQTSKSYLYFLNINKF